MTDETETGNLDEILSALRHDEAKIREQAIQRLVLYAGSATSKIESDALTGPEGLAAWRAARRQILRQSRIVEALLIAIDDPSFRIRATTALMLGEATIP